MAGGTVEMVIARSPADVFAVVADVEQNARWSSVSIEGHLITPGPVALGSRAREVSRILGRRIEVVSEVVDFVPERRLGYLASGGPFPVQGTFATEPVDGGTRVTATFEARPEGIIRFAGPLLSALATRQLSRDLARLRSLMEAGEL